MTSGANEKEKEKEKDVVAGNWSSTAVNDGEQYIEGYEIAEEGLRSFLYSFRSQSSLVSWYCLYVHGKHECG